jgi:hypothetical protein
LVLLLSSFASLLPLIMVPAPTPLRGRMPGPLWTGAATDLCASTPVRAAVCLCALPGLRATAPWWPRGNL